MYTTNLRKVGSSVMLAIPPVLLDLLHLRAGDNVGIDIEGDKLIVKVPQRPSYSLDDLLSECDAVESACDEECEWLDSGPFGREIM